MLVTILITTSAAWAIALLALLVDRHGPDPRRHASVGLSTAATSGRDLG
jgi:hypothetical protein